MAIFCQDYKILFIDIDEILMKFGDFIRIERLRMRLSQEMLAEKASLHKNCISKVESGKHNPTLITILKLAKALEIEPYKLLMFSQDK